MKLKTLLLVSAWIISISTLSFAGNISTPPDKYDSFYKKYMDCDGIPVISSEKVDDRAFYRLELLLNKVLENRPDIRKALIDEGFKYIIIAQEEEVTDVPEYAHMEPKKYWNQRARGFGGQTTSCGEENLLLLPNDRYFNESIFIHELAHGIHLTGLAKCEPDFQSKLDKLYKQAIDKGLYKNDYAATNAEEYWAESFQAFYDCDAESNFIHNHVNTRSELIEYDKDIADLIAETMRITDKNDWSYYSIIDKNMIEKPTEQLAQNGTFDKYIWCAGFDILGTKNADNNEMLEVYKAIRNLFYYRADLLEQMAKNGDKCVVYNPKDNYSAAKNVNFLSDSDSSEQLKAKLGMLVHDIALAAIEQIKDDSFHKKLNTIYQENKNKWSINSQRKIDSEKEYFATGVEQYFDGGYPNASLNGNHPPYGGDKSDVTNAGNIQNRKQLQSFDPDLAKLVQDTFKYPNKKDWKVSSHIDY